MLELLAEQVPIGEVLELFEHYQAEHCAEHDSAKVLVPSSASLHSARVVLALAGRDMPLAKAVVSKFIRSPHRYWHDRKWALWLLENPKDFELARLSDSAKEPEYADPF